MRMRNWETSFAIIACEYLIFVLQIYMVYLTFFGCSFCGQNEDNDPSEEFEEYLTCTVCGDHCMFIWGPGKKETLYFLSGDLY